jgi:hypothetical protein
MKTDIADAGFGAKDIRAVVLLRSDDNPAVLDALLDTHDAITVHTVHTDAPAVLSALIAVQHALEHLADAVVIPHLRMLEPGTPWWVVSPMPPTSSRVRTAIPSERHPNGWPGDLESGAGARFSNPAPCQSPRAMARPRRNVRYWPPHDPRVPA